MCPKCLELLTMKQHSSVTGTADSPIEKKKTWFLQAFVKNSVLKDILRKGVASCLNPLSHKTFNDPEENTFR